MIVTVRIVPPFSLAGVGRGGGGLAAPYPVARTAEALELLGAECGADGFGPAGIEVVVRAGLVEDRRGERRDVLFESPSVLQDDPRAREHDVRLQADHGRRARDEVGGD